MPQIRNMGLTNNLLPDLQGRYEPNLAWACAGAYQQLTGLRGWWSMGPVSEVPAALDLSNNGRHLYLDGAVVFLARDLAPYASFGRAAYLYRGDEAGLDTLGSDAWHVGFYGMTAGCWVRFGAVAGATETIMAKAAGAGHRTWKLQRNAAGTISFSVSTDGTNYTTVTSTVTPAANTWTHVVGRLRRYGTTSGIDVFVNRDKVTQDAAAIAALFDSDARLTIASTAVPDNSLTGFVSNAFLCAAGDNDVQIVTVYEMTRAMYGV